MVVALTSAKYDQIDRHDDLWTVAQLVNSLLGHCVLLVDDLHNMGGLEKSHYACMYDQYGDSCVVRNLCAYLQGS